MRFEKKYLKTKQQFLEALQERIDELLEQKALVESLPERRFTEALHRIGDEYSFYWDEFEEALTAQAINEHQEKIAA